MIVCLGWGSLIWSPRDLPTQGAWHEDGPLLPIEFARVSNDRRLTLVINRESSPIQVLWTQLAVQTLDEAVAALARREGCEAAGIGHWSKAEASSCFAAECVGSWARARSMQAVVWTALKPGFPETRGLPLSCEQALQHLAGLRGAERARAEEYVRRAPRQTSTRYRSEIERRLGWTPLDCDDHPLLQ